MEQTCWGKCAGPQGGTGRGGGGEDMTGRGGEVGPAAPSTGCGTVGVAADTLEQLFSPLS